MAKKTPLSPLMAQYKRLKNQYRDSVLLCRVGDFYEAFFEDAELIARELEIVLTSRDKDKATPMAGIPHHALDSYLYKLVKAGHKVAILEQIEDAKNVPAGELVKRDIVRIVTPGTLTDPKVLDQRVNNYLIAVCIRDEIYGFASVDLSTGEFAVTELQDDEKLWTELHRLAPKELLLSEVFDDPEILERIRVDLKAVVNTLPDWRFAPDTTRSELLQHFNTLSLDGFGCEHLPAAICAAGALIYYLHETQKQEVEHILSIHTYTVSDFMILDADTQRNLELTTSIRDGSAKGTLLETIDQTVTPMGARKLRSCLLQPLLQPDQIIARLNAVEEMKNQIGTQEEIRDLLNKIYDMERLISRISLGTANARDLLALKDSLYLIPAIKDQLGDCETSLLQTLNDTLDPLNQLATLIESAIHPEPPITLREGGLIRDGYSGQLDELRAITSKGKSWIAELQQLEREKTGVTSLKIGFNQVFGYYIEVTKSNLHLVPDDYIRKQTLTNAERFITPELKEREAQILNAQDQIQALEHSLFLEIRAQIAKETERIQKTAAVIGMIDVIANLAYIAAKHDYEKPIIDESDEIIIRNGRHPVVERLFTQEGFVPNDTSLNCRDHQMDIITGPNMSGKCVRGDTLVFTDAGLVPIASLQPGKVEIDSFAPVSYRVKGLNGNAHATHFYAGGRRRTVRIRTRLGYELEGTPEHRIWARQQSGVEGWKPLGKIESSDAVAIDHQIDLWGACETIQAPRAASMKSQGNRFGALRDSSSRSLPARLTPDLAYLVGWLVGDGVSADGDAVSLETKDAFFGREFRRIIGAEFGYSTEATSKIGNSNNRESRLQIRCFIEALGLAHTANEQVPAAILGAPKTVVSAFLQGLFDSTSHIDAKGDITLFTPSVTLAKQVHTLLLNFGIVSALQEKKVSRAANWIYRISITGVDASTFCQQIGFRHLHKKNGAKHIRFIGYRGNSGMEHHIERTSVSERYVFDSIVDITSGSAEVFDLSVEESHSFVANGFVNHNSTYLRQTALITLFAQMGSFVPASAAKIGIVDRIFTRVGASDNLVMGQSTFLVEMNETANILNNATSKSLIILDEIGRGTSTFDGLSIAWAVAEYILDKKKIGGKTLFATHYHELIELAGKYKNVKNFNVAVHEDGEKITFLRKVVEGGTDQSYGIHVARLAGLPLAVIARAQQILEILEQHNLSIEGEERGRLPKAALKTPRPRRRMSQSAFQDDSLQLALFTPKTHPIVEQLQDLDLNEMTPMGALNLLYQLKAKADE